LKDLDDILGGLANTDLIILAGRPSMGKTALVTNIAYNVAKQHLVSKGEEGCEVGFFSLEMAHPQLTARMACEAAEVSSQAFRRGNLTNEEFTRVVTTTQEIQNLPLHIDDTPALTISALRTRARRLKRQHNIGLIVVDYLQLIAPPPGQHGNGRVNEVTEITAGLKQIAKELNVPVIALSQLSRAVEQRDPPRPQLSDLRESGSIEQDADVVMFVYRDEYYHERKKPARRVDESDGLFLERESQWKELMDKVAGIGEVIIGKNRHGPIGDVTLSFIGAYTSWRNLSESPFPASQRSFTTDRDFDA